MRRWYRVMMEGAVTPSHLATSSGFLPLRSCRSANIAEGGSSRLRRPRGRSLRAPLWPRCIARPRPTAYPCCASTETACCLERAARSGCRASSEATGARGRDTIAWLGGATIDPTRGSNPAAELAATRQASSSGCDSTYATRDGEPALSTDRCADDATSVGGRSRLPIDSNPVATPGDVARSGRDNKSMY